MKEFEFRYGDGTMRFSYPEEDIKGVIEPTEVDIPEESEEDKIRYAIEHPLGCGTLEELIKPEETVCLIVPDTTRQWGRPAEIIKVLVEKLESIGVKDENMLIISATGTHKNQTKEEHIRIVGQEVYDRIKVVDHDCNNNLVKVGTSFRNNEILVNKTAMSYDHRITVGAAVFHFLAGFGGARKYILPGIAGRDTIMDNHSQYFAEGGVGSGQNPLVAPGLYEENPVSLEMFEAARMAGVDFNITDVIGPDKKIAFVYAGDISESHAAAVEKVRLLDGAFIDEPAEMVITSGMGYPKDINLYQTISKPLTNSLGAIRTDDPNSVMILVSECREGIGNADTEKMLFDFDNARDREIYTRENYTIGLNIAYMITACAESFHLIVVSSLDPAIFKKSKIHAAANVEEAIALAHQLTGKEHLSTYIMPYGANTCVGIRRK